jgi:hypothetical protein
MNAAKNVTIVVLVLSVSALARAVVRLENYRYANSLGMCDKYKAANPFQLVQRDKCLENTQTRTSSLWHLYYALTN